jgi:hypothetical protein
VKSPNPGWIIEPVGRAVSFVGEETKTGGLLKRGLIHLEGGRQLFQNLLVIAQRSGIRTSLGDLKRLYDGSPYHEQWAKELRASDYRAMNSHALIAIWGALETCVEDTVIAICINYPQAAEILRETPLNLELPEFETFEDVQRLYKKIERKLGASGNVVERYASVLNFFSLTVPVSDANAVVLTEANAVRNCLLHRGGKADARTVREAPDLRLTEGSEIHVSSERYLAYHDAVGAWLVALSQSVVSSRYFPK